MPSKPRNVTTQHAHHRKPEWHPCALLDHWQSQPSLCVLISQQIDWKTGTQELEKTPFWCFQDLNSLKSHGCWGQGQPRGELILLSLGPLDSKVEGRILLSRPAVWVMGSKRIERERKLHSPATRLRRAEQSPEFRPCGFLCTGSFTVLHEARMEACQEGDSTPSFGFSSQERIMSTETRSW